MTAEAHKIDEWWNNTAFIEELDRRYEALESGEDKGVTVEQLQTSIEHIKLLKQRIT